MKQQRSEPAAQDRAYRWIKQYIASVPREEGGFLTEAEVTQETSMSRTPVREALLRLEAEGFLQIVPKKGAFIPPLPDSMVEAVFQARTLIEEWCIRVVAPRAADLAEELDEILQEQRSISKDPVAFIELDRAFHRTIVVAAENQLLADFYESLRDRQLRMGLYAVFVKEDRARRVLIEHSSIVAALRELDPDRAAGAMIEHLDNTMEIVKNPNPRAFRILGQNP